MTTPKALSAHRACRASKYHSPLKQLSPPKQLSPLKPLGPALQALCTGDQQSPCTPNRPGLGTTTTLKAPLTAYRSCHYRPPKQQSPPKRGGQSQRTRCAHSHKLVPSLPVFTPFLPPFCSVFTPLLPRFYPVPLHCFTPFLPYFYPVPLHRFYLCFTPFLPHLCRVKCQTYPVFNPLLPHR